MITPRNELETIPAWEHVAGDSIGVADQADTAQDLINAAVAICSDSSVLKLEPRLDALDGQYDIYSALVTNLQALAVAYINNHGTVEDYCTLNFRDGVWMIRPYVDSELPRFNDSPTTFEGDHILIVNDHGNVTCQRWNADEKDYITICAMV